MTTSFLYKTKLVRYYVRLMKSILFALTFLVSGLAFAQSPETLPVTWTFGSGYTMSPSLGHNFSLIFRKSRMKPFRDMTKKEMAGLKTNCELKLDTAENHASTLSPSAEFKTTLVSISSKSKYLGITHDLTVVFSNPKNEKISSDVSLISIECFIENSSTLNPSDLQEIFGKHMAWTSSDSRIGSSVQK